MKIRLTSVFVDDQDKALTFYTDVLGFVAKQDIPLGDVRWLTVVPPEEPDGVELVLEPDGNPALEGIVQHLKRALFENGIPFTAFVVEDIHAEYERLRGHGVVFHQVPTRAGPVIQAVFDDTCGNLIQVYQIDVL